MTHPDPHPAVLTLSHRVVLASFYGLILYFAVYSTLALGGVRAGTVVIWFLQTFALWLFAPGMHRQRVRTHAWLSFVVLLYFTHGVLVAFDPARRWLGLIEVALCVILFVALVTYIRQYRQHYQVPP